MQQRRARLFAEGTRREETALAAEVGGVLPGTPPDGDKEKLERLLHLHLVHCATALQALPRRLLDHPPGALLHAAHEEKEHLAGSCFRSVNQSVTPDRSQFDSLVWFEVIGGLGLCAHWISGEGSGKGRNFLESSDLGITNSQDFEMIHDCLGKILVWVLGLMNSVQAMGRGDKGPIRTWNVNRLKMAERDLPSCQGPHIFYM